MVATPQTEAGDKAEYQDRETIFMVLGRMLADRGYGDLFRVDPQLVAASLKITLTSETIAKLRNYLELLEGLDLSERAIMSSQFNSLERWKQS